MQKSHRGFLSKFFLFGGRKRLRSRRLNRTYPPKTNVKALRAVVQKLLAFDFRRAAMNSHFFLAGCPKKVHSV